MNTAVLPFLCGALLENAGDIANVCRDLQKKIEKSLGKAGWSTVVPERIEQIGENVRLLLIEESARGAADTQRKIDRRIIKNTQENRQMTTPAGYIASDGEVMVLISLFEASRHDVTLRKVVQSKLGFHTYSEALLAYAYLCTQEAKRSHKQAEYKFSVAAEALHFSKLRFIAEESYTNSPQKVSAKCKHFEEHKLILHCHLALEKLIPDLTSLENASLKAIDIIDVQRQLEERFSRFGATSPKLSKAIQTRCKQVTIRFARNELRGLGEEKNSRKYPTVPAMQWMVSQLNPPILLAPGGNEAIKNENHKVIPTEVRKRLPWLSNATIRGWIRTDTDLNTMRYRDQ